ncbi:MAG: hypothetical protein IJV51_04545 [Oscillospiraceae bacterium]|nr:hypothetical protein [Oscillospiraceae bacterium]
MNKKNLLLLVEKWKLPLLILLAGLALMLIPASEKPKDTVPTAQEALAELLSKTQGVGKAQVLISESGVVVACSGASNASVRLDMIRAVSAYTGFGSDKIIILKLRN